MSIAHRPSTNDVDPPRAVVDLIDDLAALAARLHIEGRLPAQDGLDNQIEHASSMNKAAAENIGVKGH